MSGVKRLTGADPVYWPCEYCEAGQGERCRSRQGGRALVTVHVSRRAAVELFERYGIGRR